MPHDANDSVVNIIQQCLNSASTENGFSARQFFECWFRTHGSAYFFLFQKNLSVTNLQAAELLALLRTYVSRRDSKERVRDLQFLSVQEFVSSVQSLVESYGRPGFTGNASHPIARLYSDLFEDIVVVDLYFGSCTVFLPNPLDLDQLSICANAGFIHSCGVSLINRNISKASKEELFDRLDQFLNSRSDLKAPIRFIVYAHEDYTPHDRRLSVELRRGLDEAKVFLDKYYLGNQTLISALKDL